MDKSSQIESYRRQIDQIDDAIMRLLLRRVRVVAKLHALKARMGLPLLDHKREAAIIARLRRKFPAVGNAAVEKVFRAVIWVGKSRKPGK